MKAYIPIYLIALLPFLTHCGNNDRYNNYYEVTVAQTTHFAASGLDLQAVGGLVQKAKDGADLERLLNDAKTGINNLDLDEDGKVDYIQVTEYGEGDNRGFSLTVELSEEEEQEIATIDIEKTGTETATVQTHGNPNIYGNNHYYRSSFGLTDALLLGWMFSGNRPHYHSGWGYGNYPGNYNSYPPRSYDQYQRDIRNRTTSSTFKPSTTSTVSSQTISPNSGKTAKSIRAPLKNPTTAQKSFQTRNPSKQLSSGGFGRSSSSSSSPLFAKSSPSSTSSNKQPSYKPSSYKPPSSSSSSSSPSFRKSSFGGGSSFRSGGK
jgi:hypothetical protein